MSLEENLQITLTDSAEVIGPERASQFVVVCEHASKLLPARLGNLGLSVDELESHIAWDPGAARVAEIMADAIDGILIKQRYSRLAYDCNRPPSSIDAMREVSETTHIPGNKNLSPAQKQWRIENIYEPFHKAIENALDARIDPVLITVHSFTPVFMGKHRDVGVGILHDQDARLADEMLRGNIFDQQVAVRRNEPYGPQDGVTHTLIKHGVSRGFKNVMLEIRNDLIVHEQDQKYYAERLAQMVADGLAGIVAEKQTGKATLV